MLKIGVIGCGAIGKEHIRRLMHLIPNAEVVACTDYFIDAAKETAAKYGIPNVYQTGEELIAASEVEAIVITSSDASHAAYVLEGVKAGKQVFCEKPLAQTAADCEAIMEEEVKQGRKLVQVGFMRRYDPGYVEIKKVIDSGELGEPLMIHACHRNVSQGEGFQTEMGITNVAIHELDICRWLLGDEYKNAQVLKVKQSARSTKGYDNPQIVLLETENGSRIDVELQVSDAYGYDIQCQVVCEKGTLNLPDPSSIIKRSNATCSTTLMTDWADRFIEAYDIELADWVTKVEQGEPAGPSSWDGYAACVAADSLNRSRGTNEFLKVEMIEKPELYK
ncbi:myo-inositol 2-dehydrogenase/D-chiro-inositol 1-dehydrogenase [Aequitasia blattaphilus]|uniref:Inositol 2-dehydrogenase/D-chiro-inositol 3-dehydrogenase n=1 Tax=Aequitasia blattaphilus TaxID=2949332 RepID=A0ABT1E6F3_9FIRM|nr:Gfo/Idh/MocA family oxidoreductase [Aequitasia blattaphilus]MCP1101412.1 Gfo/Idh/MocA family oxidoreductase [Aequitasia blattaphilus]MCR8614052.1 Gfo/Idh/MocA family oxidoreductase [Aequitasia blattaphilus]